MTRINFKGNYDNCRNCDSCQTSCIEQVRFAKPFKEIWHSENDGVKDHTVMMKYRWHEKRGLIVITETGGDRSIQIICPYCKVEISIADKNATYNMRRLGEALCKCDNCSKVFLAYKDTDNIKVLRICK